MSQNADPVDESFVLSSFTTKEKQALFQHLRATMAVDGEFNANERAVIEDIMEEVGLSDVERQAASQLGKDETLAVLRAMDVSKKEQLGEFMARVICADRKILPIEDKFFECCKILLGLPDKLLFVTSKKPDTPGITSWASCAFSLLFVDWYSIPSSRN